MLVSEAKIW